MKVANPVSRKIVVRLKARKGEAVPIRDFFDLGTRHAVDQALSRLVRQGVIRRVRRGLYEYPRMGSLLKTPLIQSPDGLIRAWARQNGLRVVPSGAQAANLLGLSTQVPAKIVYYTNGRTQTLKFGSYTVKLLNRGPKTMEVRGRIAPLVFQALRHLGRDRVTPEVIRRLQKILSRGNKAELNRNLRYAAAWMRPVIEKIAGSNPR